MLEPVIEYMPILVFFLGAMFCLVFDYKKKATRLFLILIPVVSILFIVSQILQPMSSSSMNLSLADEGLFMILICIVFSIFVLINWFEDFKNQNVEIFSHALGFLITGSILGFIYSDNLFLVGIFTLMTQVFMTLLKFISSASNKKVLNLLLFLFCLGFIFFLIGCLILFQSSGTSQLFLSSFNVASVPLPALVFIFLGMLINIGAFPISYLVYHNIFSNSHVSIKIFYLLFHSIIAWKFLKISDILSLFGPVYTVIYFILGLVNIFTGIGLIFHEIIYSQERKLNNLISSSIIVDFGVIIALIGMLGEIRDQPVDPDILESLIMDQHYIIVLQVIITMLTKIVFIASGKNVEKIFQDDLMDEMGGLKFSRPSTLVGFLLGGLGNVILGIFVMDGIYKNLNGFIAMVPGTIFISGIFLFFIFIIIALFTITWFAFALVKIFGGNLPIRIKSAPRTVLRNEDATIILMVILNIAMLVILILAPSLSFLDFIMSV
ncbi:MAG: hypothetical protein ACFFCS_19210 [Candidatus Hodarchaeota archaeon]